LAIHSDRETILFNQSPSSGDNPLADRMRPRTLDDVLGQDHIVGKGRLLRRAIQADRLSSVIFYGPPGTGKTSLARVIANTTKSSFESLNAVLTGIKDAREAIDRATERQRLYGKRTILFVDEVHRWNKAQQDALLPWVENGTVILIGATTENPFFEVNRALVSRSRIFQLKPLTQADLLETAKRALADAERGYGKWRVSFEESALEHLVEVAGGDARSLLNALELAVETSPQAWPPAAGAEIFVSLEASEESIQRRAVLYDRDGDYHFDTISAFIKSVRGSDPDASLYWLAKMVRAGEDPSFIFRRMIILASEDVGMADPKALQVVISCADAFERIGFPEGNYPLAHACLYLATAPKSNSAMAFFDALKEVEKEDAEVPNHLKDASRDSESFGHGDGYIYPHAYRDHWAAQQYLPTALRGKTFYVPSKIGYEANIRDEVIRKREVQAAVVLGDDKHEDILTWTGKEARAASIQAGGGRPFFEGEWLKRLTGGRSALLLSDRNRILDQAPLARHDRALIARADDGLLLWETLRRVPEGLAAAVVSSVSARDALLGYASTLGGDAGLDETERPLFAVGDGLPAPTAALEAFACDSFDRIFAREPWRRGGGRAVFSPFAEASRNLLAPDGRIVILQSPPVLGERISRVLLAGGRGSTADSAAANAAGLFAELAAAEDAFFASLDDERLTWTAETLEACFRDAGLSVNLAVIEQREERLLTKRDIDSWFDAEKSSWGTFIARAIGGTGFAEAKRLLTERARQGPLEWQWQSLLMDARV
jgi:putative ATPase